MKNKSVHSCRFVHHAKFHCIMTTLNKLFKIKFEGGEETGKEPQIGNFQTLKSLQKMIGGKIYFLKFDFMESISSMRLEN